ncbi:UPF0225 protein YchJ [hydrothermal vent metagenome]|uniref:UPF0225 protein YchJ n=1 Tax=hydrothermal vent metagenome TaxID=652676 RepID=A0A3B0XG65_9ZZZZ
MNKNIKNNGLHCICGNKTNPDKCCLALINKGAPAKNAEALMRSRYTGYVLGQVQYLLDSWHSSTRPSEIRLEDGLRWTGLSVLKATKEKNNTAYVEFAAQFESGGKTGQMHERSQFVFENNKWFYVQGEQIESATQYAVKPQSRNAACACGSGKKFKKCCANKFAAKI